MKISVIMPVYNEEKTLLTILGRVQAVPHDKEIIIVDDCSTDSTRSLLESIASDNIRIAYHEHNRGKGAAVRTALQHASGEIIIIQDGDLEYDPTDYLKLVRPIIDGQTNVVYGSRVLGHGPISYRRYSWGARFITWVGNILYSLHLTDLYTCYKVIRRELMVRMDLHCMGFEFCPEVTAKLSRMGQKIIELPISYNPRPFEEGKKIRPRDGLIGIWTLLKYRFWNESKSESKNSTS